MLYKYEELSESLKEDARKLNPKSYDEFLGII